MSPEEMEVARLIDAVTEGQPKTRAAIAKMIAVVVATATRHARNEALEEAAAVLVGHRDLARASKKAMKTDIMRTKWDGIAEALEDMAEEIRSKQR